MGMSLTKSTFLKEDALQKRILVTKHQTFVSSMSVGRLQIGKVLLVGANSIFKLLDVLSPALTERSLSLAVPLLPFLGCGIDLYMC